jgi:hypothetical protein
VRPELFHAAGAAHGTLYFKMLDDAAFYACNSLVTDRFLLTTAFNLLFTKPLKEGPVIAEGRWASGRRRVLVGEARLLLPSGEEAARGTGHLHALPHPAHQPARLPGGRMTPRLASSVLAGALIRKAEGDGGFAAVLAKGDPTAGAILLILTERGANPRVLERLLKPDGTYSWAQPIEKSKEVPAFVARRRQFDPIYG